MHRYARDLIDGLNHGLAGWIDWNCVLDSRGGPNHAGNLCAAPVMVDLAAGEPYFTPVYWTLAHFSRYVRPGDHVVLSTVLGARGDPDGFRAVAVLDAARTHLVVIALNRTAAPLTYAIEAAHRHADVTIPANALQTIRLELPAKR